MPRTKEQNQQIRHTRQTQILQAARVVFAEQGFHNSRMSDIAHKARVSQGTLYHYFNSKDDLFMSLLSDWSEKLAKIAELLPTANASATAKLRMVSDLATAFIDADKDLMPVLIEFWAYAARNPQATASFRKLFITMQQSIKDVLVEGVNSGEFKPLDIDTLSAVPLIILDGVTLLSVVVGRDLINPSTLIKQTQDLIFEGLLTDSNKDTN